MQHRRCSDVPPDRLHQTASLLNYNDVVRVEPFLKSPESVLLRHAPCPRLLLMQIRTIRAFVIELGFAQ